MRLRLMDAPSCTCRIQRKTLTTSVLCSTECISTSDLLISFSASQHTHPKNSLLCSVDVDGIDGSFVTTMLRMGFKYEIAFFKKSVQKCLRPLFPTTLDQWNGAQKKVQDIMRGNKGFLFDVINVAHGNNILTILPAAFLSLYVYHSLVSLTAQQSTIMRTNSVLSRMRYSVE